MIHSSPQLVSICGKDKDKFYYKQVKLNLFMYFI